MFNKSNALSEDPADEDAGPDIVIYFLSWVGLPAVVEPDPAVVLVESAAFCVLDADELD